VRCAGCPGVQYGCSDSRRGVATRRKGELIMTDFIEAIAPLRSAPGRKPQLRLCARRWRSSMRMETSPTWMPVPMLARSSGCGEFDGKIIKCLAHSLVLRRDHGKDDECSKLRRSRRTRQK
jgi:hypothetical protein